MNYIKNIHQLKKALVNDYGKHNASKLVLKRNPFDKLSLSIQTPSGVDLDLYQRVPNLGWIKAD